MHLPRLVERFVVPGGWLIVGDYGSRSRSTPARDVVDVLRSAELPVAGEAQAHSVQVTRFAWVERTL